MRLSRRVPYALNVVHHVIADVESYPHFVPGVVAANITQKSQHAFTADLDVKILGKAYSYRSHVTVDPLCIRAKATTFMGQLEVAWHLLEDGDATYVDFILTTSIPGFDWLLPQEWPKRIMASFAERCACFV